MSQVVALRTFEEISQDRILLVHGPSHAADVYNGQGIEARLRLAGKSGTFSPFVPVYRLSPLGAEVDVSSLIASDQWKSIEKGTSVDLNIRIAKQSCDFFGLVVASQHLESHKTLLGIRWCQATSTESVEVERRKGSRWLCGEEFLPTGIAPNPARFNDFMYFRVVDVSRNGMQILTSLRNKLVIPGMTLQAMISFPLIGQVSVPLKVLNARIRSDSGKDYLSLGVSVLGSDPMISETLGQYVLQFGPGVSIREIKEEGLRIRSAESAVDFSFVKTADNYREVLKLRRGSYGASGKLKDGIKDEDLGDIYDTRARIVMARHKGKLVGSLRLMFHTPEETCEYEQFLELPKLFPKKNDIVVVSRVCTDPQYRGSDLVYGLVRQCVLTAIQSKRRYILGGSSDQLLPLYERVGMRGTGVRFSHGNLNGVQEQLILGDVVAMISGVGTTISAWSRFYADLSDFVHNYQDVDVDPLMNLRLNLYRAAAPVLRALRWRGN